MKNCDALIIGGGIIGASLAFELCLKRQSVILIDRQQPGQEASWAAAGTISPAPESSHPAMAALSIESYRLYPSFAAAVESATAKSAGFHPHGALELFFGPSAEADCNGRLKLIRESGVSASPLSLSEATRLEPAIGPSVRAALRITDEAYLDPRVFTRVTLNAAENAGTQIHAGAEAISLVISNSRCAGVLVARTSENQSATPAPRAAEKIEARNVIVAAGWRSSQISGVEPYAPTAPVRGQMISFRSVHGAPRSILRCERGYIAPREDGSVVAGSTLEPGLLEKCVTPAGLQKILAAATDMAPALSQAPILESWAGLRPDSPDHLPIIGATAVEGLFIATGHYRNGLLLAPATAKYLAEWIAEGRAPKLLEAFSPLRFASKSQSAASNCPAWN